MVYTVTFNPCIDFVVKTDKLITGAINRSTEEFIQYGGKGINVSSILHELDTDTVATGFVAGFTGEQIENNLKANGIDTDFVHLPDGFSRINIKIRSDDETDINTNGPDVSEYDLHMLIKKLEKVRSGDVVVISGSAPKNMDDTVYSKLLSKINKNSVMTVVDTTGKRLLNTLDHNPFLIKPNLVELMELFDAKIDSLHEVERYAIKLQNMGARNVLVSMSEYGSVLFTESKEVLMQGAIKGKLINSVGAGDSMIAGFIAGYLKKKDFDYALKLATAAGSATAFSIGLADRKKINEMMDIISSDRPANNN